MAWEPAKIDMLNRSYKNMAKINPIQLQKHLKGMDYPADKDKLVQHAQNNGADDNAISVLKQLPDGDYGSPTAVSKAVSGLK